MTLTVVALNGSQIILHQNDIGSLTSYRAYGGMRKSNGQLDKVGNYTGVPLETFLNMVGGIKNGYSVKIIATYDNTVQTLSYKNLNGTGLNTYSNTTGAPVQHNQTLTPMLAYYYNDKNLTSGGPLRLAIVGPEGLCTDGSLWVKNVTRLEIHPNLQPMSLTIVALNGSQQLLNETNISVLPALRAVGAFKNQKGVIKGLGNYTGPSLNTFLNLAGGMNSNNALRVTALDGYNKTLSYEEVNGEFATYDVTTGQPVQHNQPLTPILAYHFNDANLSSSDGPLRLAIIGPEGLATGSSYWVKQVVKLEVRYRDDVAVTAVFPSKSVVGQNNVCEINVTAQNEGGYDETFNVTVYANQTVIGTQIVTLSAGDSTTITLTWDTTGFVYGNYKINAYAWPVEGETYTDDNTFVDGNLVVTIPGDANGDRTINFLDAILLGAAFGSQRHDDNWNPNVDINSDGHVNYLDAIILGANFGQSWT
jgi:DMSO/TMAO reductase YedYZ molybdopterin-dependent catalytic subunit